MVVLAEAAFSGSRAWAHSVVCLFLCSQTLLLLIYKWRKKLKAIIWEVSMEQVLIALTVTQ